MFCRGVLALNKTEVSRIPDLVVYLRTDKQNKNMIINNTEHFHLLWIVIAAKIIRSRSQLGGRFDERKFAVYARAVVSTDPLEAPSNL